VPPPATGEALHFPSVEARLEVELECLLSLSLSRGPRCKPRPPPSRMLRGLSPASFTEEAFPPTPGALPPGFGIPLCAGVELSFLATLPPLGMKLVILEVLLFELSASTATGATSSFSSSPLSSVRSGTEMHFPASFPFSFSFSFPLSLSFSVLLIEPFLAVRALLKVRWAMPLRAILGLLAVVGTVVPAGGAAPWAAPLPVPLIPGRTLPSSSSRGSVLDPVSALSAFAASSCLARAALSLWAAAPLEEVDDLELPLLLKSLSFSSIDFGATTFGGASALQEVSFSCLTDCMADAELLLVEEGEGEMCLELTDLLLQGLLLLLLLGWGMAVEEDGEEEGEDNEDGGGIWPEVAAGMLVEEPTVTADDGACSVITKGCEVMPSEESAAEKRHRITT